MSPRLAPNRRRPFKLAERRAQERSTSMAPITLYSTTMSQLEADRQGQLGLLRPANAGICAHLRRSSTLHRSLRAGAGGLKPHSLPAAASFNRVYPPSGTTLTLPKR